ncbi:LacI family DNA-binding transcriptional regulator [Streptomyces sp. NBC_01016]|uniref:LacI family DNA-binding transcriptional regulator n=1 Tax=Streptomyces sp. NBC_01016 TaxID=2903720 RepID=UPI002250E16B|nr:LacI family DNA-binding transcriptional regulator [Streptomyces sp. NBC_01016]MCX4834740.1 LacI family DNA-binding transcriptional regulator [Streptomyces sp. NBC_01016]
MPTTMTDVARAAGVSQKTVSRVVNGEPYVSAEIRERVHRAIRDLDFRPNNTARALLKGRHRRIGVVSLGSAHYGPTTLLMALERAMQRAGYAFALAGTRDGRDRSLAAAVASLLTQGVDGVVLSEPVDDGSPLRFRCDVPMVSLGEPVELSGAAGAVVCADGVADARCATEHLLALGHRTVWHIPGPDNWFSARDRERGWRAALAEAGVAAPPLAPAGDWTPASGYRAARQLARDPDVTAVFVANDEMALGALRAFTEAGRRVPEDVSVVGFDDIPAAAYLTPPLTTVRQDFATVATRAVDVLTAMIEDTPRPAEPPYLASQLVLRESTAPRPRTT